MCLARLEPEKYQFCLIFFEDSFSLVFLRIWLQYETENFNWFSEIEYPNKKKKYNDFKLMNTCTIDYFLFAVWVSSKISNKIIESISVIKNQKLDAALNDIIDKIDNYKWNRA